MKKKYKDNKYLKQFMTKFEECMLNITKELEFGLDAFGRWVVQLLSLYAFALHSWDTHYTTIDNVCQNTWHTLYIKTYYSAKQFVIVLYKEY